MVDWAEAAVALVQRLHSAGRARYDHFAAVPSMMMSLVGADGALELYDGSLRLRDAEGTILRDGVPAHDYMDFITESVKPWSYMKFPYVTDLGAEQGWYKVGPLARVQNCDFISTPRAEAARRVFIAHGEGRIQHGVLAFHWARMIEMLHAAELIRALLPDPDLAEGERMASGPRKASGVGVIEAPRGTLIHHYWVDEDDLVRWCNLIVSTTHNNEAMNRAIREVAARELSGRTLTEGLLNQVEVAIRAFDPCLSCATHALGKMPLEVSLVDAAGACVDRLARRA